MNKKEAEAAIQECLTAAFKIAKANDICFVALLELETSPIMHAASVTLVLRGGFPEIFDDAMRQIKVDKIGNKKDLEDRKKNGNRVRQLSSGKAGMN